MLEISLLGTSGMLPLPDRYLSSVIMRHNGSNLLIDCGEGTQMTLKTLGWRFKAIDYIMFTHFHADHISGLPGLLLSMGNSGRTEPVKLIGPDHLKEVVKGLLVIAPQRPFDIEYIEFDYLKEQNFQLGQYKVTAFPVEHGLPCVGYTCEICRQQKFMAQKAQTLNIPVSYWSKLQNNQTVEINGVTYKPEMVLGEKRKGIKVSFCTDTKPISSIIDYVDASDLLICEGMYGEKSENQNDKYHMDIFDAAEIAKKANVKAMWLTHYSPSFSDQECYEESLKNVFPSAQFGYDRMTTTLHFED